jgi:hypothetical protein
LASLLAFFFDWLAYGGIGICPGRWDSERQVIQADRGGIRNNFEPAQARRESLLCLLHGLCAGLSPITRNGG